MNNTTRQNLAILGAATLAFTGAEADAATIFSEDFQTATASSGDQLTSGDNGGLAGWSFDGNNIFKYRSTDDSLPGAGLTPNYGVQTEWSTGYAKYDTTHSWTNGDVFTVDFNATEQNWSNGSERYVRVRIRETVSGNLLWQGDTQLAQYDAANTGAGGNWAANQTHQLNFSASDFGTVTGTTTGTENSLLTFEIGGADKDFNNVNYPGANRGTYIDNIEFSVVPEPGSLALLGLGGLLIARRRRS